MAPDQLCTFSLRGSGFAVAVGLGLGLGEGLGLAADVVGGAVVGAEVVGLGLGEGEGVGEVAPPAQPTSASNKVRITRVLRTKINFGFISLLYLLLYLPFASRDRFMPKDEPDLTGHSLC